MKFDIVFVVTALLSMLGEIMLIFRKDTKK